MMDNDEKLKMFNRTIAEIAELLNETTGLGYDTQITLIRTRDQLRVEKALLQAKMLGI